MPLQGVQICTQLCGMLGQSPKVQMRQDKAAGGRETLKREERKERGPQLPFGIIP